MPKPQIDNTAVKRPLHPEDYPDLIGPPAPKRYDTGSITQDYSNPFQRAAQKWSSAYLNSSFANSPFMDVMRWIPGLGYVEKILTAQPVSEEESMGFMTPVKIESTPLQTTRLYRGNPVGAKFNPLRAENGAAQEPFAGRWFTDDPNKPAWYLSNYSRGKAPFSNLEIQYIDIPTKDLIKYKAENVLPKGFDFEPEDYILNLDMPIKSVPVKNFKEFGKGYIDYTKYIQEIINNFK